MEPPPSKHWIRGVNLGGWFVLERYITPYLYAITDCHVQGDLCWYANQTSAPSPEAPLCDLEKCQPILVPSAFGYDDYPVDEYTLGQVLGPEIGAEWLNYHFENFITREDLVELKEAGLSHVRVPLPHWIMGDLLPGETWIVGQRWECFLRLLGWCRELGIQVWPDIHTAPGSQNGFDNSGLQKLVYTCAPWIDNRQHVDWSLKAIDDVTRGISEAGFSDVVTGFGLLNEPFFCDHALYRHFIDQGLEIVRTNLGEDAAVFVSDAFTVSHWNDGSFWLDPVQYNNTYLDSHYYQVFAEEYRALSPRQHIAYACQTEHKEFGVAGCCYEDAPKNTVPSRGVQRIVSEFSAAVDTLPVITLRNAMQEIGRTGQAPQRSISPERGEFLRNFLQAQMVTYETTSSGVGSGWFYWTAKMEGSMFSEWDFLRGVREGWVPKLAPLNETSESLYGTCFEILFRTDDDMKVIHEFPDSSVSPDHLGYQLNDDVVVSHGEILHGRNPFSSPQSFWHVNWLVLALSFLTMGLAYRYLRRDSRRNHYTKIDSIDIEI